MPVMDGYQASQSIRNFVDSHELYQPMIVACTAHTEHEYIQKAWTHQIDEVLPKPINFQIFQDILKGIIIID